MAIFNSFLYVYQRVSEILNPLAFSLTHCIPPVPRSTVAYCP